MLVPEGLPYQCPVCAVRFPTTPLMSRARLPSDGQVDAISRTKYIYSMHSPLPKTDATLLRRTIRALPYLLSWSTLAVLMIVGMNRMPLVLYTPIDGEWAKWNVEAILHFGKVFDLSPYSMLAGMGSMYFPNLPWLNPGALALGYAAIHGCCCASAIAARGCTSRRCAGQRWPSSRAAATSAPPPA